MPYGAKLLVWAWCKITGRQPHSAADQERNLTERAMIDFVQRCDARQASG
jgi:hypothetical protein